MRNGSARHNTNTIAALRLAIDCMPLATREAMLEGVRANERIIVGAYVDGEGGTCPMLAAHRCGGRTDFLAFARSWDRFAGARKKARVASRRELAILVSQLEASISCSDGMELDHAIAEHRRLRAARLRSTRRLLDCIEPRGEILVRRVGAPRRAARKDAHETCSAREENPRLAARA